jgi:transcriptional regulator GlxA family with amidase domain
MREQAAKRGSCCAEAGTPAGDGIESGGAHSNKASPADEGGSHRRVQLAIAFIEGALEGDLSLRHIARQVHHSKSHFARAFKRDMGVSVHAYVMERRLQRARELLLQGEYNLCEIALMCGFCSQAHLTTLYKRRFGCTPGQCREQTVARLPNGQVAKLSDGWRVSERARSQAVLKFIASATKAEGSE